MRIVNFVAENVKKLKLVEITPKGDMVEITGKNGSGKTSVLDSILWGLGGKDRIQGVPIRKGAEKLSIKLNLGKVIVERKLSASGAGTLTVTNAEGAIFPSPQKMLDALLGELSFDPLAFTRMKPKEQFDELQRIAKIDYDFAGQDEANRSDFARRTEFNRDAKAKRARAAAIAVPEGVPSERIDEGAILDRIEQASSQNAEIEKQRGRREQAARDISDKQAEASRLTVSSSEVVQRAKSRIAELLRQMEEIEQAALADEKRMLEESARVEKSAVELQARLNEASPLPVPVDVSALRAELDTAKTTNRQVAMREQRDELAAEASKLDTLSKELTAGMALRDKSKEEAIARAAIPVEGIGFGDGTVTFKGLPFDQASSAEQLYVSVSIAMASNPKLRIIRIQDGSLLDEDSMALISKLAGEKDYQVWIERVDSSGKVGIVMEDGAVVGDFQLTGGGQ